jgi:hypothetical protein
MIISSEEGCPHPSKAAHRARGVKGRREREQRYLISRRRKVEPFLDRSWVGMDAEILRTGGGWGSGRVDHQHGNNNECIRHHLKERRQW